MNLTGMGAEFPDQFAAIARLPIAVLKRLTKYLEHQVSRNALKSLISGSVA